MDKLIEKINSNYVITIDDMRNIAEEYVLKHHQEEYFNGVISNPKSRYAACYDYRTNNIVLNDEKIVQNGYRLFDENQKEYHISGRNFTYYLNYYNIYVIYHELIHLSQQAQFEKMRSNEDVFQYLYKLCNRLRRNSVLFYNRNHDIFPMEIDAINRGNILAYEIINKTNLPRRERNILRLRYYNHILSSYEKSEEGMLISPFDRLLDLIDEDRTSIMNWVIHADLSKRKRLNYGLSITEEEYKELEETKQKILIR